MSLTWKDTYTGTTTDLDTTTRTHSEDIEKPLPDPEAEGAVLFTGPDGVGDHRVTVTDPQHYVGHVTASTEASGDVRYLCRAPKVTIFTW